MGFGVENMELNNHNKAVMSLALAILSENLSFSRYSMRQAQCSDIYKIKSKDGSIDYLFDFKNTKDFDSMFRNLLHEVLTERSKTRVPTIDELNDDELALKKFVQITNSFVTCPKDQKSLEFTKFHQDQIRIQNHLFALCEMAEEANILNGGVDILTATLFILDKLVLYNTKNNTLEKVNDFKVYLNTCSEGGKSALDDLKKDQRWIGSNEAKTIDHDLGKEIAKLMTYNLMSKDIDTQLDANEKLNNTLMLSSIFSNGQELTLYVHDRECLSKDIDLYKCDLFNEIMSRNGFTQPNAYDPKIKEAFTVSILKDELNTNKKFLAAYENCIDNGYFNFGRDQYIVGAVALNILGLNGLDEDSHDLETLDGKGSEEIINIFANNYERILKDPLLAYRKIQKVVKSKAGSFKDYLQSKYPDAEIVELDLDDIENIPDELMGVIGQMIEEAEDEDEDDYDPTTNYPYPDEDEHEKN